MNTYEEQRPMDEEEMARIIVVLRRADWVRQLKCPGLFPDEIAVDTQDGKSWRIARPLDFVRLRYLYQ